MSYCTSSLAKKDSGKWGREIPYWDRIDGTKGSRMDKFSNSTLKSMKESLSKAKTHKAYRNNLQNKLAYINWRLSNES
jgi:hypothetical protein